MAKPSTNIAACGFDVWWRRVLKVYGECPRKLRNSQNVGKLSACANSGYQALFLLPQESLGTRLVWSSAHLFKSSFTPLPLPLPLPLPASCLCHSGSKHAWRPLPKHLNFNSLLAEMITPQTYIQVYIYIYTYKTASCSSCIRGSLRLALNYSLPYTSLAGQTLSIVSLGEREMRVCPARLAYTWSIEWPCTCS